MGIIKKDFGATAFTASVFLTALIVTFTFSSTIAHAKSRKNAADTFETAKESKRKGGKKIAVSPERPSLTTPRSFTDERVTRVLRDLKGRAPRARSSELVAIKLPAWTSKAQWLQAVYSKQLVDSSNATGLLSDKLLFYEVAKRELGEKADQYLVRTVGLRDFLVNEGLVDGDGRLVADGDRIESSLFKAFPAGFVARPAVGVAPRETGRGLFKESDEFVSELLKTDSFLYRPEHRKKPVRSTVLDAIASGEAIVLQDDLLMKPTTPTAAHASWREVRVHTYEGRVIADANPNFWIRDVHISKDEAEKAQKFVGEFLSLLPSQFLSRQAFSFDVLIQPDGTPKIVDLVTNRGRKTAWSGYLDQPRVLGAYTRHFESYAGVHFNGVGGYMLRKNAGNYFAYWGLRIDKSRPGVEKVLAWIPPWP